MRNSILLVDDEVSNIKALFSILSDEYEVFSERSSVKCMETVKKLRPDLILLDVLMPEKSGFDVIQDLSSDADTRDIPVIFVTGLDSPADEANGFALGAADYIYKPFNAPVVKLRVRHQVKIVNLIREIQSLSTTDALTGIGNRRYFNDILAHEWEHAKRLSMPLGLLILDIDNFKNYNDTNGHLQGDEALKLVAQTITENLHRAVDKVARWGGEEFAVVLPNTDFAGVCKVAETIRHAVESKKDVTVSIGAHAAGPKHESGYTMDNFVSDSDMALYEAKRTGKNRVCTPAVR